MQTELEKSLVGGKVTEELSGQDKTQLVRNLRSFKG